MTKTSEIAVKRDTAAPPRGSKMPATWPPFASLRDEIDRLFESFEPRGWFARLPEPFQADAGLVPAMDLIEKNGGYQIAAELPGMEPEKVEVKLAGGLLTIKGEKSEERDEEQKDYHLSERRYGMFQRSVRVPDDVDADKIEAKFANGVLTVTLPKSETAKAAEKKIEVKAA